MDGTIRKLFGAAVVLALLSAASWYAGSRVAADAPPPAQQLNALSSQFAADPGDGWMLFGGFLLVVAVAVACAGAMLWAQEAKDER
jgi:hypothetical protein